MSETEVKESVFKSGYVLFPMAILLLVASIIDINNAFMVCVYGVPVSLVIFIKRIIKRKTLSKISKWLSYIACVVLFVSGPLGCSYNIGKIKQSILSLSSVIEEYKLNQGVYPAKIENLNLASVPLCNGSNRKILYSLAESGEYSLTCSTYSFSKLSFLSKGRVWKTWD